MTAAPVDVLEVRDGFETLIGRRRHVVVAVSGGADSMALMHLLAAWRARADRAEPILSVATVDHGLRSESVAEAAFVAAAAQRLGLAHVTLHWPGPHPGSGLQAAAREARYRLLIDHAKALGASGIALAHSADDQAETFLMRLMRGSGLEGLAAMRSESWREGIALVRPLLALPKLRLMATLQAAGHRWIEDPSNADERFERVRIRKFLTLAAEIGLTAEKIALSARRLGDAETGLRCLLDEVAQSRAAGAAVAPPPRGEGAGAIPPAAVPPPPPRGGGESCTGLYAETLVGDLGATEYLAARTLRQLIRWYGGAAREPELAQLEQLAALLRNHKARRECGGLTLGGCKIELLGDRHDRVRIYREGAGENIAPVPLVPGRTLEWDGGRFSIRVEPHARCGARVEALGLARWARLKKDVPALEALRWPAAAAATLPVIVRLQDIVGSPAVPTLLNRMAVDGEALHAARRAFEVAAEEGVQVQFRDAPDW